MSLIFIHQRQKRIIKVLQHAVDDPRFGDLEMHMKRHHYRPDALIEVLHKAQDLFGCLEDDLLLFIAYRLKMPTSRVYGVATFYHYFTRQPPGRHTCMVCSGTACYVKGANAVLTTIENFTRLNPGETTPGHYLSLLTARCLGRCSLAPVVVYDGVAAGYQTPESVLEQLKGWEQDGL